MPLFTDSTKSQPQETPGASPISLPDSGLDSTLAIADVKETVYAEELGVGDHWSSDFREVTASDVETFADLTGDHTPLHGDDNAGGSPFGRPVAHGLLGLSILAGLGTEYPKAMTLALVSIENWEFLAPVYFGDSVQVRNEILSIDPHGRRAVKVRWLRQLLNDTGRVVQQGHFTTLVGSRQRAAAKPR